MNKITNLIVSLFFCSTLPLLGCQQPVAFTSINITNQSLSVMEAVFKSSLPGYPIKNCHLDADPICISYLEISKADRPQGSNRAALCFPIQPLEVTIKPIGTYNRSGYNPLMATKSAFFKLDSDELRGITKITLFKDFIRILYADRKFRDEHYS